MINNIYYYKNVYRNLMKKLYVYLRLLKDFI